MAGLIKGGGYTPVSGSAQPSRMIKVCAPREEPPRLIEEIEENLPPEEPMPDREALLAEIEQIREQRIADGDRFLSDAQVNAARIRKNASDDAAEVRAAAQKAAEELKKTATERGYNEGYEKGYNEGNEKGYDEGYKKALRKCKETLLELKSLLESINSEKDELFKENERELFDTIFVIAQKVTVDTLKQKEKGVITKMLKEAGKHFRGCESIKITLSELDMSENVELDFERFREVLPPFKTIEFELEKDAPAGTLKLESGGEILDASVGTQLKMIEELGKGKYRNRDKESDKPNAEE